MDLVKLVLGVSFMFSGSAVFAHGEDKLGPNGGEIRMPGTFHTEVLILDKNKAKIYLLDINFKNPTVDDTSVDVTFSGHHKSNATCEKEKSAYICTFGKDVDLKSSGTLEVLATYKKQKGNPASYKTPFIVKK